MEENPTLDQCLDIDDIGLFSDNVDHNLLCLYSYSDSVVLNESSLNIIQWNVRGLFGKQDQVVRLIRLLGGPNKVQVVCLNETWLRTETSSKVVIPGYNIIHKCRVGKKGGGLSILVSNDCTFREIDLTSLTHNNIEIMAIEIKCQNANLLVGNVYRPPNTDLKTASKEIVAMARFLQSKSANVAICGDHNIDLLKASTHPTTQCFLGILSRDKHYSNNPETYENYSLQCISNRQHLS